MTPEQIAELETSATAAEKAAADAGGKDEALNKAAEDAKAAVAKAKAPSQKPAKTEKEKAAHVLRSTAERLRSLGEDPADVLGIKPQLNVGELDEEMDDNTPLTLGTLKKVQKQEAHKTALQMAQEITDEQEREQVVDILSNRIRPSGNAQKDLDLARAAVNSERNAKIAEEANRKGGNQPRRVAAGGSMNARQEDDFVPTEEEKQFMTQYGLSKEKILEARRKTEARTGPQAV